MDSLRSVQKYAPLLLFTASLAVCPAYGETLTFGGDFDLPIPSPDSPESEFGIGPMDDALISIHQHLYVADINVAVSIRHTSALDLQLVLRAPDGTGVCLNYYNYNEFYRAADYTDTIFDDDAPFPITEAKPPFTGRFRARPPATLRTFRGLDASGLWRLQISDNWYGDTGRLTSFQLTITTPEPSTIALFLTALLIILHLKSRP